ncbi:MAG: hypothetical protein KKE30_19305 [Gammaproteobacteria bacterium]|nr:hypothetical protein [Gammaproteobacteria bacterium]MBU1554919.1 hypothetical protein [Gammaproteobacteria bacterium]MBU2069076.1 hypothetical protein [Gammaproteobacteria bacterium]MBU2182669.1 hypothetical protein [Gammaproteobacteria bacterium]MBU2206596.1 hypothetical protein [Gammaproteobacteria bacterium]
MKDILEPLMFPQNIMLYALLLACCCYRKKGLWLLLAFYYLAGNSFVANQLRDWYGSYSSSYTLSAQSTVVVLGCGGSEAALPACAKARLQQLAALMPDGGSVIITSRYCQPYVDYLLSMPGNYAIDCFFGGDNTYKEFNSLAARPQLKPDYILTSDFHAWRVTQLTEYHGFTAKVVASSSQTFRPLNCSYNCFITVNLSNFDFYSKLMSEFASYAVFVLSRNRTDWYQPDAVL